MYKNVVITHIKADFDAISSAWGAALLHGSDAILLSTSMDQSPLSFFQDHFDGKLPSNIFILKPDEIAAIDSLDLLVMTDCKQHRRLGELDILVDKAKKIAIYDHHPTYDKDIKGDIEDVRIIGATTTIILERLVEQGVDIKPFDATVMLMGIYEDTGMLTFSSTTPADVQAVAKLIELGGDVTVIREYVTTELNRDQVFVLNELLMNMSTVLVGDVSITYSYASLDHYLHDLAYIVRRMMEMEMLQSIFVLIRTGPQIFLIGRSNNLQVDASVIAAKFGGGGHPAAASASFKDLALPEATEMLRVAIREHVKPVRFVKEIMNSPAKYMRPDVTFDEALTFTMNHNLNHMPVVSDGKTVGIVSRKDILQGIKHGLAEHKIDFIMQRDFEKYTPDTPFHEAEYAMVTLNQKLLPIEEDGKLVGVITRTDLLRLMHEDYVQRSTYEEGAKARLGLSRVRNILDMMKKNLNTSQYKRLVEVGKVGVETSMGVYIVGGFVRDLLMNRDNNDMDFVVEGDAILIAAQYARMKKAKLTIHERYKTATVNLESGDRVDFATARTEYYLNPGAVPNVESSSLRSDLMRRDFTVNSMAIRLDGDNFGQLIDFFGGQRDILDKKIRVLHSLSFVDDPARIFRAIRFAGRFGFELCPHTERLLRNAERIGLYSKLNRHRLFMEISYILNEDRYMSSLNLLKKYGLLQFIVAGLAINDNREDQFSHLDELYYTYIKNMDITIEVWRIRFTIFMNDYNYNDYKRIIKEFDVEEAHAKYLVDLFSKPKHAIKRIRSMKAPKPSELYEILSVMNEEELIMLTVLLGQSRSYIVLEYLNNHRKVKTKLDGNDLKKLGIMPSKEMGMILKELFYLTIDGELDSKDGEIDYAKRRYNELLKEEELLKIDEEDRDVQQDDSEDA